MKLQNILTHRQIFWLINQKISLDKSVKVCCNIKHTENISNKVTDLNEIYILCIISL